MFKKSGTIETTFWENPKVPSIRYWIFQELSFVKDGFSTRIGGVSGGQFSTLNFSVKMGDEKELVEENFRIFTDAHQFTNPVMTDQTHTTNIRRVYREDSGKNIFLPKDYSDIDGFVTDEPGVTLVTTYADCVPLYFVDCKKKAIGLAHSGWRGTIQRMGQHMVKMMEQEFGSQPEDLVAAIGPSICVKCYEVSRELAEDFAREFHCDIVSSLSAGQPQDMHTIVLERQGKYFLNLWAANYIVLREAKIPETQIAIPDICTCCNPDKLFSHRASKGKRGNLCAFLMIKE